MNKDVKTTKEKYFATSIKELASLNSEFYNALLKILLEYTRKNNQIPLSQLFSKKLGEVYSELPTTYKSKIDELFTKFAVETDKQIKVPTANQTQDNKIINPSGIVRRILRNLTATVSKEYIDSLVLDEERERAIDKLFMLTERTEKTSAALLGPAGVGKSALVEKFAYLAKDKGVVVYTTSWADILEQASYIRMQNPQVLDTVTLIVNELIRTFQNKKKAYLFIDEFHSINSGGLILSTVSPIDIFKPPLARGELNLIIATTTEEYNRYLRDKAFRRRMMEIYLSEPSNKTVIAILNNRWSYYGKIHQVDIEADEQLFKWVTENAKSFFSGRNNPDAAIDLLDILHTAARIDKLQKMNISEARRITDRIFNRMVITDRQMIEKLEQKLRQFIPKSADEIANINYPKEIAKRLYLKAILKRRKPLVFMFYGETGTGKTYTAEKLAELLNRKLYRYDMNQFSERHTAMSLFGAPPSYVGYGEPSIVDRIKEASGNVVILLDEFEKAHPRVIMTLLNALDSGQLQDNKGELVDISNVIFVLTSNIGMAEVESKATGMGFVKPTSREEALKEYLEPSKFIDFIKKNYQVPPEFLNRIDLYVPFIADKESVMNNIENLLKQLLGSDSELQIEITPKAKEEILRMADEEYHSYNYRAIRRILEEKLLDKLLDYIFSLESPPEKLQIDYKDSEFTFNTS